MSINSGKTSIYVGLCFLAMLTLSGCGRYSLNEKEQHLYETAERVKGYASNAATKGALIQAKYSSQMMDQSVGVFDQLRQEGLQAKAMAEQRKKLLAAADGEDANTPDSGTAPASQQIVSQYATSTSTADNAAAAAEATKRNAAVLAAQAKLDEMKAAQMQQLQAMQSKFDPSGNRAKMQAEMSRDMSPSDLARALAERDKALRGMGKTMKTGMDKLSKMSDTTGGAADADLSRTANMVNGMMDGMINVSMPTHIYYVTPEIPWSIALSGEDDEHKLVCRGYGEDLSKPLFVDEYDMTWK